VLVDERVAEAFGDGRVGRVGDFLDDTDEQARRLDRRGDENGAALKRPVKLGDCLVGDGVVQRVARGQQLRRAPVASSTCSMSNVTRS